MRIIDSPIFCIFRSMYYLCALLCLVPVIPGHDAKFSDVQRALRCGGMRMACPLEPMGANIIVTMDKESTSEKKSDSGILIVSVSFIISSYLTVNRASRL